MFLPQKAPENHPKAAAKTVRAPCGRRTGTVRAPCGFCAVPSKKFIS